MWLVGFSEAMGKALSVHCTALSRAAVTAVAGLVTCTGCTILPPAAGAGDSAQAFSASSLQNSDYQYHSIIDHIPSSFIKEPRIAAHSQSHRTPRTKPPAHQLMTKPVAEGVLTSGHGYRLNPTGKPRTRWHKGIDYAAPVGTLVFAAGDGIIVQRYTSDSYGNYLRIRHSNGFSTAYAHMHRFAKKVQVGNKVKKGQVIGEVGSTGRSTGPHLHFEVIHNGKFVNPLFEQRNIKQAGGKQKSKAS